MLNLNAKAPGPVLTPGGVAMSFRCEDCLTTPSGTGRETPPCGVMTGDAPEFRRAGFVGMGRAAVQPIRGAWKARQTGVHPCLAGSATDRLLERSGRCRRRLAP